MDKTILDRLSQYGMIVIGLALILGAVLVLKAENEAGTRDLLMNYGSLLIGTAIKGFNQVTVSDVERIRSAPPAEPLPAAVKRD